jgi:DNA-binding CsgD family transcriptional regulator
MLLYDTGMARRWTQQEERLRRDEIESLYVRRNLSIGEVGEVLGIAPQTVYQRMKRLAIPACPERKMSYRNMRHDIVIPTAHTNLLAEFIGIMLGDGKLSPTQVQVTLGSKEDQYVHYVRRLMSKLFGPQPKVSIRQGGYKTIYLGSVRLCDWLLKEHGLVYNKVAAQVAPPYWVTGRVEYMRAFLRSVFDTDGSVYALHHGIQIAYTNRSIPLLSALQYMLSRLHYTPSEVSGSKLYLTRKNDIARFFREIAPRNNRHVERYHMLKGS